MARGGRVMAGSGAGLEPGESSCRSWGACGVDRLGIEMEDLRRVI